MSERLHIAVGVILNETGDKVLIAKRPDNVHQGGLWEFPGGKVHSNETVQEALKRELQEELNLIVENATPLICINHDYYDLKVKLDVWTVDCWSGEVRGNEGQIVEWILVSELKEREFPDANVGIVKAIEENNQN